MKRISQQWRINSRLRQSDAFVLPTALIASAIILAGCIGLALAGTATREGSARQQQARAAQDVAEAGLAITMDKLNSRYRYLLTQDLANWSALSLNPTSICPGAQTDFGNMPTSGNITNSAGTQIGSYSISSYTFHGNSYYGGFGILKVSGNAQRSGATTASSIITTKIQVVPKNCGGTIVTPPTTSGFPGLMASNIDLGGNDVLGQINGNILCLNCTGTTQTQLASEIGKGTQSVVNGTLFGGSIPLPNPPDPPTDLATTGETITTTKTYTSGSTNGGFCVVETDFTACRIASINLAGSNKIIFNTTSGPMRIYVDGNVSFSGNAFMQHTGASKNLAFFGLPADSNAAYQQTFVVSGGSTSVNAFIHMPDACVGINGGSNSPDFLGAIWSNRYGGGGSGGCGSSSNNGDVRIPDDMGKTITETLGDEYNISVRDFAAAGVSSWSASTGN